MKKIPIAITVSFFTFIAFFRFNSVYAYETDDFSSESITTSIFTSEDIDFDETYDFLDEYYNDDINLMAIHWPWESDPEVTTTVPSETESVSSDSFSDSPSIYSSETSVTKNPLFIYDSSNLQLLLQSAADEVGYTIIFPDNYDDDIYNYLNFITSIDNPELYRDILIETFLTYIGITPDNPYYDVFYSIAAKYYDDVSGLTKQANDEAGIVAIISIIGSISLLGFVKWVI